ncbi:four-carbon acid sugar kinase family protein [Aridibaculum aurantiacum]|uniref:four-carbon acid sugar kinase family protein n=1 Tax=Aridibaculum aurantiacum TaxID=2810307 RepID=UPI001A958A56|nr:four-carbon acid sugar kinase family protein [Aridibaculum aurantiacum]
MKDLLLAFYGDDFTGSTDALEFLSRAGMKAALFIEPPTVEQLAAYPGLNAIGVAGMTRSLPPHAMQRELQPAFEKLKELAPRHVHYKVCSTFDSSPEIGSIGKAIDVGASVFANRYIPLLVAAPPLGRYCLFGNLFARLGIGSNGNIYRLDRHPSMSKHPVTPSNESDLRLHLAKQTNKQIELVDILQIAKPITEVEAALNKLCHEGAEVVLFDALEEEQLLPIGEVIDKEARAGSTVFSVGSSGIEMALGKYWNQQGVLQVADNWATPGEASPLLVLSGSCSPVTASQIHWAIEHDFKVIEIDVWSLFKKDSEKALQEYIEHALDFLSQGTSVIVHTGGTTNKVNLRKNGVEVIGSALGNIARGICEREKLTRIVVAGGDTSSYAARAMGIEAVTMIAPLAPGAPLCKASAPGSPLDGIEINFKGGQVGAEDYFGLLKEGKSKFKSQKSKEMVE